MINIYICIHKFQVCSSLTTPQDAHMRLVVQGYLDLNPSEFSTTKALLVGFSKRKFTAIFSYKTLQRPILNRYWRTARCAAQAHGNVKNFTCTVQLRALSVSLEIPLKHFWDHKIG